MEFWGKLYSDPGLAGWRSPLARTARKHAATAARDRKEQLRRQREHTRRMAEVIAANQGGKKK